MHALTSSPGLFLIPARISLDERQVALHDWNIDPSRAPVRMALRRFRVQDRNRPDALVRAGPKMLPK
jgi:hypothetical protein